MDYMEYMNNKSTFSRMASSAEIKASLYKIAHDDKNPQYGGIPLFADENAVYVEHDDKHTLIYGLTGSKKTRLIGMPALRTYAMAGESFIANDPKGELFQKMAPVLNERGYQTVVINLREPLRSNSWNPLQIPYTQYCNGQKDKAIEFVMDMSTCITHNGNSHDPYWENSAASLLAGLIMVLFEYAGEKEVHFKSLRALRSQAFKMLEGEAPYIRTNFLRYVDKSSFLYSLLSGTADVTENTRSCIISVFDQAMLSFFCQDNLLDMLSGSDFEINAIGRTKTAVFLITPDENTVYNKLVSVFVKQCYAELLREAEKYPDKKLPLRVNLLLDEFANLPAITDFQAMITASRSRNIRFNLFIQSKKQLADRYGFNADTIQGNCENWVFLHSREYALLDEITVLSGMKNTNEPLVTPTMLQTLDKDKGEAFIFNKRLYPYIANLLDIDQYPHESPEENTIIYPENGSKADNIFDFEECCCNMPSPDKPIFTSVLPASRTVEDEDDLYDDEEDNERDNVRNNAASEPPDAFEKQVSSVGYGWHGLVSPILKEVNLYNRENKGKEITISQIKEKYGTLNIHARGTPDYIDGMITLAEKESAHVCEICGARGKTVNIKGWYSTLCPSHAKAKKAAGYDQGLESRLYRKFMDTYERGKWTGLYNPVIKRSFKRNWFTSVARNDEVTRVIKFKREKHATYFYVKTRKELKKHEVYVQWFEDKNTALHEGYWHVMAGNNIETFGVLDRKSAEREAAKKIYYQWKTNRPMELIRMVSFEEGLAYPQCGAHEDFDDFWEFVKGHLVKNNIKMTGAEHGKYGVPLIENNGIVYAFILSRQNWGKLMAETFEPGNRDKSASLKWANERPEGETSWVNPDME